MFKISYEILDNERFRISKVNSINDFEMDVNTIVGQIQFLFQKNAIGFVDKEIPYEGEFLMTWLSLLNKAMLYLCTYGFATIYEPDTDDIWLEFEENANQIRVSRIIAEKQEYITSYIESTPKIKVGVFWNEDVSKDEFYGSILKITDLFIKDVLSINKLIAESNEFNKLESSYFKAIQKYLFSTKL